MTFTIDDTLINYDELYKIFFNKFLATHEEIRYWVIKAQNRWESNLDPLDAVASDMPYIHRGDVVIYDNVKDFKDAPIFPPYHFYLREQVEKFNPRWYRFVYLKDLTAKRNWLDYKIDASHSKIIETLKKANEVGILRFYDFDKDEFTLHRVNKRIGSPDQPDTKKFWSHTADGEKYLSNPDSFFLVTDILTVERVFLKKPRDICLKEMGELSGYDIVGKKTSFHDHDPSHMGTKSPFHDHDASYQVSIK
jgi:hypothetical protein